MHRGYIVLLLVLLLLVAGILAGYGGSAKGTAEWHLDQGNNFAKQGRLQEAIAEYDEAIRLDPQDALAYANRTRAHTLMSMDAEAEQDFNRAVELGFDPDALRQ